MKLSGYVIRPLTATDEDGVQALFEADPEYFELIQGAPPGPAEFQSRVTGLAPGKSYDDKFAYCVIGPDSRCVSVIDMVRGYPEDGIWFVGLLFVERSTRGRGLGSRLVEAICAHAAEQGGRAIRIAVAEKNGKAMQFWERAGFGKLYIAERERARLPPLTLHVMERRL